MRRKHDEHKHNRAKHTFQLNKPLHFLAQQSMLLLELRKLTMNLIVNY